ncbi:MAG: YcxB family protein [Rhizobiaceae bacterium]
MVLWGLIIANIVLTVWNIVPAFGGNGDWVTAVPNIIVIVLLLLVMFTIVPWLRKRNYFRSKLSVSDVHFLADEVKIIAQQAGLSTEAKWSALEDISRTPENILLWLGKSQAFIIPMTAFSDSSEAEKFYQFSRKKIGQSSSEIEKS